MRHLSYSEVSFIYGAGINKDNRENCLTFMYASSAIGLSLVFSRDIFYSSVGKILLILNLSLYVFKGPQLRGEVEDIEIDYNKTNPVLT